MSVPRTAAATQRAHHTRAEPAPSGTTAPCGPVLELAGVTKTYGDVHALSDADLTVHRGELLAVVGPSGSGKSTMLHIMGTLTRPTSGTVRVAGHDVEALSDRELSALRATHIGFVFQQFHLARGVPALDSVADGLLYSGTPLRERRRLAERTLRRVGLGHRLLNERHQLSGGERQRVAIARAVLGDPPLLLADEPTGALDSRSGAAVMDLLHELHRAGTTVVIITHDRDIAAALPREVRVRDGRIAYDSGPARQHGGPGGGASGGVSDGASGGRAPGHPEGPAGSAALPGNGVRA